ncbi:type I polyketide synthase [Paenibacillus monticola]|uniref:SDR family NAD(P)-dependent oxidoreductase n=1 Tax=Paenibacillus monticola TaxID=2666075 RepID=A0A7X2H2E1_9BACL|nr:type I polyketide synthase [Paenibacillus monticola]MRN52279.1 SDR family NAD(P)-dependent oxidoreductase [Paenibacillus monticola]
MKNKLLNWSAEDDQDYKLDSSSSQDIAIIGMSGRLGCTDSLEEFWNLVVDGEDGIGSLPDIRRNDIEGFVKERACKEEIEFVKASYLKEIDKFDNGLFSISPAEANLMDPEQRIFLETAWAAIEDAGYGGGKLSGTETGVFIGYSSTISDDYITLVERNDPELLTMAVPGNLKSIIPSRISYLLDLRGPSMLIDTACSSSLVALHVACQSLLNADCEYAIAGGVKINVVPGIVTGSEGMGTCSSDGKTRTFDENSDGTGVGEGVAAVLLKPLNKALSEGDHIYAVVKGSAINQDGASMGLTAPNSAAQERVIRKAWEAADIEPESLSYIEAHGTATDLGDPIEIDGIRRAYHNRTRRNQFCAIGSVKTNIGHLDSSAGISGLIKVVLSLYNKKLPPSLHFKSPNRKIQFIDSPVYVNDRLQEWKSETGPRRAAVSSFGLSGTNAHVILEEAPSLSKRRLNKKNGAKSILTLSAKNVEGVQNLVTSYRLWLHKHAGQEVSLDDMCYTANTGRGHYTCRAVIIFDDLSDLATKLLVMSNQLGTLDSLGVYYGISKVVPNQKKRKNEDEITEEELLSLTSTAADLLKQFEEGEEPLRMEKLCLLYIKGAGIDWERLYRGADVRKVSLPVYPFAKGRCWMTEKRSDRKEEAGAKSRQHPIHPLIDLCLADSMDCSIYSTIINTNQQWEIGEHRLENDYLMLGTGYVEMMTQLARKTFQSGNIELRNVVFASPLFAKEGVNKEVQTIMRRNGEEIEFKIVSKNEEGTWIIHSEGIASKGKDQPQKKVDPEALISRCSTQIPIKPETFLLGFIKTSPRWQSTQIIYFGDQEAVAKIELAEEFREELEQYMVYPSLLDSAANAANSALMEGVFLPLLYGKIKVYAPFPYKFYSHIKYKDKVKENQQIASVDITLMDPDGFVFAEIEDYTIKKVNVYELIPSARGDHGFYYNRVWQKREQVVERNHPRYKQVLIIQGKDEAVSEPLAVALEKAGSNVIRVRLGDQYSYHSRKQIVIRGEEQDYKRLAYDLVDDHQEIEQVIFSGLACRRLEDIHNKTEFYEELQGTSDGLFYLVKHFVQSKVSNNVEYVLLSNNGYVISRNESFINPFAAAIYAMSKALQQEYSNHIFRCIDLDGQHDVPLIMQELVEEKQSHIVSYRNGSRYVEQFSEQQMDDVEPDEVHLHSEGAYVITGGTGGIGLEIAKYLASITNVRLVLLNRTPLPPRLKWEEILHSHEDHKVQGKIRAIQEIEAMGSQVDFMSLDISNYEDSSITFQEIRKAYGKINGVIHSAGVAGEGFLIRKEKHQFDEVVRPKVHGTWNIDHITKEDKLDFYILFSSLTAVFGSPGQSDYTMANSFMDSYAQYRSRQNKRTITINWPGWSETGMAVEYGINQSSGFVRPMTSAHGIRAFHEILHKKISGVMVGRLEMDNFAQASGKMLISLSPQLEQSLSQSEISKERVDSQKQNQNQDSLLSLTGKSTEDLTQSELKVAQAWATILGMNELDLYDKFLEIGGDSLLATYLLKEINVSFPGVMDITDVFIYSTILEMADYIDNQQQTVVVKSPMKKEESDEQMERILEKLARGEISAAEVEKLI